MAGNLRRNLILKQLAQTDDVLSTQNNTEVDISEIKDTLGDFPSFKVPISRKQTSSQVASGEESIVPWNNYFKHNEMVSLEARNFKFNLFYTLPTSFDARSIPIFIFHHGAGSSGLSFANLSKVLEIKMNGKCACFAFDARGHGSTVPFNNKKQVSYNREDFVEDFLVLINHICCKILKEVPSDKISIILVGHSLGGSICTSTLLRLDANLRKMILGITMLDIVEETAIKALNNVDHFLNCTPNMFKSYSDAIDWHVKHNLSQERDSAKISIPSLFRKLSNGNVARITNLQMFKPYWDSWFQNLSHSFISLPTCKLLILAGNDNLDKELIIGQMQGKYQLVVFQDSGHFIQEDAPLKTALTLIDFFKRNDNKNIVIKSNWGIQK